VRNPVKFPNWKLSFFEKNPDDPQFRPALKMPVFQAENR
jgi:hypothetical protein